MAEDTKSELGNALISNLRQFEVFSNLPQEHLAWLAENLEEIRLQPGNILVHLGDPADWLFVILEGEIAFQRGESPDSPVFRANAGQVTGLLPYSRLTRYGGTGRAAVPTRIARLHKRLFPEMLKRMPEVTDVEVDSRQPFPYSHSAYWTNRATWDAIMPRVP